jgi:hypothetical protein
MPCGEMLPSGSRRIRLAGQMVQLHRAAMSWPLGPINVNVLGRHYSTARDSLSCGAALAAILLLTLCMNKFQPMTVQACTHVYIGVCNAFH